MRRWLRRGRRAGSLLTGLVLGLLFVALTFYFYTQAAREGALRHVLQQELDLPPEAFELERVAAGRMLVAVRDVALFDEAGDTVVAAPRVRFWLDPGALGGEGPIVLADVELDLPLLRLVELPSGEWNVQRVVRMTVAGEEVAPPEPGRAIVLRGVRIAGGRALLATPWTPPPTAAAADGAADVRLARLYGRSYRLRSIGALDARLPEVRVGGPQGWRVEVAELTAVLADPELRVTRLQGVLQEAPGGLAFDVRALHTDRSRLAGAGELRSVGGRTRIEARLTAEPVDFRDLRWLVPALPSEGRATLELAVATRADGRTVLSARRAEVVAVDSRVQGRVTAIVGGGAAPTFMDTDLQLDPLDLAVLDALGLGARVPYRGEVRGRIATLGEVEGIEGPLQVDLVATVVPRDQPQLPASLLSAQGTLAFDADAGVRLDGLQLGLAPLRLAALRPLLPEQEEWLRGTVQGAVRLRGTPRALEITGGELALSVGEAPPSRLAGLSGSVSLDPALRYELSAIAQPLALATVAELVPAFPFQRTPLFGPVEVRGSAQALRFSANLRGDVGGFVAAGQLEFGDPLRFAVNGRLDALQPARLMRQDVPFAGPVSGPFRVEGTPRDFAFDVDFTQAAGHFALAGRVQRPAALPPLFEVTGRVAEFRVGTLLGRTGLFASPLSGDIRIAGGGYAPYRFDVDLRGAFAAFDVEGWYVPQGVPSYAFSGTIAGLDLRLVPGFETFPATNLVAGIAVEGRGLTRETLAGHARIDAAGSTVGGLRLQAGAARVAVQDGVLRVDTLQLAMAGARLDAAGAWGLTQPTAEPLRFALAAPNLAALTPVLVSMGHIGPQLAGSLRAEGRVAGSFDYPVLDIAARGRGLRFDGWRAATLALELDASRSPAGWSGEGFVHADQALLQGVEAFETIRLEAVGTPETVAVGLLARRDRTTDVTLSGTLELAGAVPQGIALQALALRLDGSLWQLQQPTLVRWGEISGIEVDSLVLRRTGEAEGLIEVDGRVPPSGAADLRVRAANVDVGEFLRLVRGAPELDGVLTLEAVIEGPRASPELFADARVEQLRYGDVQVAALSLTAQYADGQALADAAVWQDGVQVGTAQGTVPMRLVFDGYVPRVELLDPQPVSLRVVADSIPAGLLTAVIPQVSDGAGVVAAEITVGGTLGTPELRGWMHLVHGAMTLDELGVRFVDIDGRLTLGGQTVHIESLTARSGGAAAISGIVVLDDRSRPLVDLNGRFDQFRAIDRDDVASIAVTGNLSLAGRLPTPTLSGRAELTNGTITLPPLEERQAFEIGDIEIGDIGEEPLPTVAIEPTLVDRIRIASLELVVGEGVWAEAPEARVQIGGELLVSRFGPDEWQVFGDLQVRRGVYTLTIGPLIREFDVVSGRLEFFGTPDLNPALDIVAQHRVRSTGPGATGFLNILVNITGTAQFPRVSLTTDTQPPLPESEILSYLIFGRPTFALGEVGGGLAQQLLVQEALGGILATQVEQLIRQAGLPFDYVRLRGRPAPTEFAADPLGTTTVEVGWQLTPEVFWTVEWGVGVLFTGDIGDTWGTSLEWQIDPQWSARLAWEPLRRDRLLQRQITEEVRRQFSLQLRRRWEYGTTPDEPTPRERVTEEPPEPPPPPPGAVPVQPQARPGPPRP